MSSSARRLYGLMALFCSAGYLWLYLHLDYRWSAQVGSVCIMKKTIGVPCPSCGSTRSMLSLLQGNFMEAVLWNPFGLLIFGGLVIVPIWVLYDVANSKRTLLSTYQKFEIIVQRKIVAWPLVFLVLMNWLWNFYKGV
jgi:hypothetical protein